MENFFSTLYRHPTRLLLALGWLLIFSQLDEPLRLLSEFGGFLFIGVTGAIFANATGAGGGVVFVPFFHHMGFSPQDIVATSFAIQCCGMTAGALTWWRFYHQLDDSQRYRWQVLPQCLWVTVPSALIGLLLVQYNPFDVVIIGALQHALDALHLGFGVFSIFLACLIFASIPLLKRTFVRCHLLWLDVVALIAVGVLGGIITAWLSVGVGEMVAVYLIIRGFQVTLAIAVAVILTAFSVWGGVIYHAFVTEAVVWPIVLFAGAGAIIGGMLAPRLVMIFSPAKLKLFFGMWVLIMGLSGLPVF